MESTCSFLAIVGGQCGYDRRDRKKSVECIPLLSCAKDITSHKSSFAFYDIDWEVDLILARAGIFSRPQSVEQLKICPYHRATLGIGWKRPSDRCKVPTVMSHHSEDVGKKPKAERGLGKAGSETIFKECGVILPVGSGT